MRVEFQGGEPLLNFKLIKSLVEWAEKNINKTIHWGIETNASPINKNVASFLKKHNFLVGISLDGPQKLNDLQRKTILGKGGFKLAMKGIKCLLNAGYEANEFGFVTVITSNNVAHAKDIAEFFASRGFLYKSIPFNPLGRAKTNINKLLISNEQWFNFLLDSYSFHYKLLNSKTITINQILEVFIKNVTTFGREYICLRWPCGMAHEIISVNPSGDVYPCDGFKGINDFKLGNLKEETIDEIIAKKEWVHLRRRTEKSINKCSKCPFRVFCGSCAYSAYGKKGTVYESDPYCNAKQSFYKFLILERINYLGGRNDKSCT